jgi:glyoxylase-like metal-dependent hydrolase (beta-lactamase superfamily II)
MAALAGSLVLPGLAQQDFSRVEIKTEQLAPGIYMLTGSGGNLGLAVGEDAVFLIDDQYAPLTPKIQAAIAAITPKPVKFILNTHWHGDHTGGNENLGKAGAIVIAQDNVRKRMSTEQFIEAWGITVKPQPRGALPVITFSTDTTFHINGDEVHAFHVARAHTDGDTLVHFRKADVIHMGDVYFNGLYPFIDASSGGTVDGVIAAADRALALSTAGTKIIPGHGPLSNREELKAYRDMLSTVSGRVRQMLKEGRKLEDITASKVTADFDEKWGKGFIPPAKFAEMIAKSFIRNAP